MLNAAFRTAAITKFEDSNIELGKLPASCSGIHQAADVSSLFRSVKDRVLSNETNQQMFVNVVLQNNIAAAIAHFESKKSIRIGPDMCKKIKDACNSAVDAIQNMISPCKIRGGFSKTGQFPLCYDRVMGQSFTELTAEEHQRLLERSETDVEIFKVNGQLTEKELDDSNVPTIESKIRDQLMIQNQRATLITNPKTCERHINRVNHGMPIGNAIIDCDDKVEKKKMDEAMRRISKAQGNIAKKDAEKARKAAMTEEEKRQEKEDKKRKREEKKAADEAQLQQAYELCGQLGVQNR